MSELARTSWCTPIDLRPLEQGDVTVDDIGYLSLYEVRFQDDKRTFHSVGTMQWDRVSGDTLSEKIRAVISWAEREAGAIAPAGRSSWRLDIMRHKGESRLLVRSFVCQVSDLSMAGEDGATTSEPPSSTELGQADAIAATPGLRAAGALVEQLCRTAYQVGQLSQDQMTRLLEEERKLSNGLKSELDIERKRRRELEDQLANLLDDLSQLTGGRSDGQPSVDPDLIKDVASELKGGARLALAHFLGDDKLAGLAGLVSDIPEDLMHALTGPKLRDALRDPAKREAITGLLNNL